MVQLGDESDVGSQMLGSQVMSQLGDELDVGSYGPVK
jgi:hypothetical protein